MYICAESKARWKVITDHDESHKNDATKEESPTFLLISFAIVQALEKIKSLLRNSENFAASFYLLPMMMTSILPLHFF
jgi:hypothetical protein